MKPLHGLGLFGTTSNLYKRGMINVARVALILAFLSAMAWSASAQSVMWTESYVKGALVSPAQCDNWTNFLLEIKGRSFASVTLSGSADPEGKTISDPAEATLLAYFLSSGTPGQVKGDNGDVWTVSSCFSGCNGPSFALSVNANGTCACTEPYTIRPHTRGTNWGGLGEKSCDAPSQSISLEFRSGAFITSPSTVICPESELQLQANSNVCAAPFSYEWTNVGTGEVIGNGEYLNVTEAGEYVVTVSSDMCSSTSDPITITASDITVTAMPIEATICEGSNVQLEAVGSSGSQGPTTNKICIYDALGGECTFTESLCDDEHELFGDKIFSYDIIGNQAERLDVSIYYSLTKATTFVIRLNGVVLASPTDNTILGNCGIEGQYPRNFTFSLSEVGWNTEGLNKLEIEIQSEAGGVLLAGIVAEVVSNSEPYSWAPIEGLTDASIANPVATPTVSTNYVVTYTDGNNCQATDTVKINVDTVPFINSVVASASSVDMITPVTLAVEMTDDNISHATIDWGDQSAVETVDNPVSPFNVSHTYPSSGSYSATVTIFDLCGKSDFEYASVEVLNPVSGTVSGGGWFESPSGAFFDDPSAHGKANFSFDVTTENSNGEPDGQVYFKFRDAGIKFVSASIEMFTMEDKSATMKAIGTIDHTPGYQILISVVQDLKVEHYEEDDNGRKRKKSSKKKHKNKKRDYIRVKIWNPSGELIYDTQRAAPDDAIPATPLGGGSIQVDEEESDFHSTYESPVASSYGEESTAAYPNPFEGSVDVQFNSASPENVAILVLDLSGKVVFNEVFPASEDGSYSLDIFEEGGGVPGLYIMVIKQGRKVEFLRLVHN